MQYNLVVGNGGITAGVGLCIAVLLTYLPGTAFGLSTNPVYFDSGLTSHARRGLLPGIPLIDPNAGTTTQTLGHLSAEDWLHGTVPWWNPYAGIGLPLAAEMQSESFFLPFVLLLHFGNGVTFLRILMQLIAGLATLALLRQLRFTYTAAFLGGLLYALNGTFAWFAHGEIMPLAFLPLLLLGIERARESAEARRRGGWGWITIAMAFSLYAGFPETAFMDGLLALLWAVLRLSEKRLSARLAFATKVGLGGLAGLLLAAPLLVPFFEYLRHSAVAHNDFSNRGLPESSLLQLFLPYVYGPINRFLGEGTNELFLDWGNIGGYLGIAGLFLAVLACLGGRRERGLRTLLGSWTVLLIARMVNAPGSSALLGLVPGMSFVAAYRNSAGSFEMAVATLAALAIDDWRRGEAVPRKRLLASIALTVLVLGVCLAFGAPMIRRLFSAPHYRPWLFLSIIFAVCALASLAILSGLAPDRRRAALLGLVIAGECMSLFAIPLLSGLRDVALDLTPLTFLRSHLGLQRAYALGAVRPNYGSYYGVAFIDHESLPAPDSWIDYVRKKLDPDIDQVTFSGDYPPPYRARREALGEHLEAFEEAGVRFLAVPHDSNPFAGLPVTKDFKEVPKLVFQSATADVLELPKAAEYFGVANGACAIVVESRDAVRTSCRTADALIRRELFYPGWHAAVNGRAAALQASSIFQTVNIPAGESRVSFSYLPTNLSPACAGALIGLGIVLAGIWRI